MRFSSETELSSHAIRLSGVAEDSEPALVHQHRYRSRRRASRGSSTVTDETLPDRSPTNQPGEPTPREPSACACVYMREKEGKRNLSGKSEKDNAGVTWGKFAVEKEERRKRGREDGTVEPASTSRCSRGWGTTWKKGWTWVDDIVREMGVYRGVNFGAKMCSGENVICLFRCCFCGEVS